MYVKEGTINYLKLQHNYILNICNVTFDSYSDDPISSERPKIIAIDSDSIDVVYVVPTMFNILPNSTLNTQQALDQDDQLSESMATLVMTESAVIVCLSSNFYFSNIDIYSEYDDETSFYYFFRFINPLYKNLKFTNSDVDISGMMLYADRQVEATLENMRFDMYKAQGGVFFDMACRDPSVIFNSTLNLIKLEFYHSQDRIDTIVYRLNPIRYFGAGNMNYYNFTSKIFTESVNSRVLAFNYLDDRCVMEPNKHPILNITNAYITIPQQENKNMADVYAPIITHSFTDRAVNGTQIYITNMTFENMQIFRVRAMSFEIGPYSDIYAKYLTFKNMYLNKRIFRTFKGRDVYFENLNIIN